MKFQKRKKFSFCLLTSTKFWIENEEGCRLTFDVLANGQCQDIFYLSTDALILNDKTKIEFQNLYLEEVTEDKLTGLHPPMPGKVVEVFKGIGDSIDIGDRILTIEAMKMEHSIVSDCAGVLTEIYIKPGQLVDKSTKLVFIEESH